MRIVLDIEANGLENPTEIWVVVAFDIDTKQYHIFRNLTSDPKEREDFLRFIANVSLYIGHNLLQYDLVVLRKLLNISYTIANVRDTYVISKLLNYSRKKHSIEDYGLEFSYPKIKYYDFTKYTIDLESYCKRDVEINYKVYLKYLRYIEDPSWLPAIMLEQEFQLICNKLHDNGFAFNKEKAEGLLAKVQSELDVLDKAILESFKARPKLVREYTPKLTKFGTISKTSIPRQLGSDLSIYTEGAPFSLLKWEAFNPASHKQIIDVLSNAGWKPTDKTKTHKETEIEVNRLKRNKNLDKSLDIRLKELYNTLTKSEKYGYKINETNLATLPSSAPSSARTLAKRILFEARRRTLTEWLGLVKDDGRIHGRFEGIGAWTHRMAHRKPNMANIPNNLDSQNRVKLLGKEMRSLWIAPKKKLLVGVDAEGVQLRIFAHYIDDPEFTKALVEGKKSDKSDPHSLNQRVLGSVCNSRQAAKRFIFSLLLGAGLGKLEEILECNREEAQTALDRMLQRYTGFARLKESTIPADAKKGWFTGLDGRKVGILGATESQRKHLCMSGYLQAGEAIAVKKASIKWDKELTELEYDYKLVDLVHDEWQTEVKNDMKIALEIAGIQAKALYEVGEELGLKCPLAGSYWNDDNQDWTIGVNWYQTH